MTSNSVYQYIKWFKIAQEVLGNNLVKKLDDAEVVNWISRENWLMLPLPTETDMKHAKNRQDPNIYITLFETNSGNEKMGIGLTCNTIKSVEKMQNILDSYHDSDRERLLSALKKLDNNFKASVSSKIKEIHFAQSPEYDCKFELHSNQIDEKSITKIFQIANDIRERGLRLKDLRGTSHPIEAPSFEIAYCEFTLDEEKFRKKMRELMPVLEACLRVKRTNELTRIKGKLEKGNNIVKNNIQRCKHLKNLDDPELYLCNIKQIRLRWPGANLCHICGDYEPDFEIL